MRSGAGAAEWPLVGRSEELEFLRRIRSATPSGSALITGPAGVGKSRLAGVALAEAEREGWNTLSIRGSPGLGGLPFGPFRAAISIPSSSDLLELSSSIERELMAMRSAKGLFLL